MGGIKVSKRYVIYEYNNVLGGDKLTLIEVSLKTFKSNRFETQEDAIQYIIDNDMIFRDYVIMLNVFVTKY